MRTWCRPSNPHHIQIWRFWNKAQKNLETRTSNLETSKICVKWIQQQQIICFRLFFTLLVLFVLPWVDIPNRESHGQQTVRVGRSVMLTCRHVYSEGEGEDSLRVWKDRECSWCWFKETLITDYGLTWTALNEITLSLAVKLSWVCSKRRSTAVPNSNGSVISI